MSEKNEEIVGTVVAKDVTLKGDLRWFTCKTGTGKDRGLGWASAVEPRRDLRERVHRPRNRAASLGEGRARREREGPRGHRRLRDAGERDHVLPVRRERRCVHVQGDEPQVCRVQVRARCCSLVPVHAERCARVSFSPKPNGKYSGKSPCPNRLPRVSVGARIPQLPRYSHRFRKSLSYPLSFFLSGATPWCRTRTAPREGKRKTWAALEAMP